LIVAPLGFDNDGERQTRPDPEMPRRRRKQQPK
jgi:hypothetical protein